VSDTGDEARKNYRSNLSGVMPPLSDQFKDISKKDLSAMRRRSKGGVRPKVSLGGQK
jgi:hypothetical protein